MTTFQFYLKKLLLLYDLMGSNRGDCFTSDLIRGHLFDLFPALNKKEQEQVNGLGGDLYMIYGEGLYIKVPEEEKDGIRNQIEQALQNKRWRKLLNLLRNDVGLPEETIAQYRALAWEKSSREVAQKFSDYALKIKNNFKKGKK